MRVPIERIAAEYERRHEVSVELQFGGSNTLLSQLRISKVGDIFIAADAAYTDRSNELGLTMPAKRLAMISPIILVNPNATEKVRTLEDLLDASIRVAIADPDAAAIGKATRSVFESIGRWRDLQANIEASGVSFATVTAVGGAIRVGSVDAGIVWDAMSHQYPSLTIVRDDRLAVGQSEITIAATETTHDSATSTDFIDFVLHDPVSRQIMLDAGFTL